MHIHETKYTLWLQPRTRPMSDVERRFDRAMFAINCEVREIGYTPSIYLQYAE